MGRFAFITHPAEIRDISGIFIAGRYIPGRLAEYIMGLMPPLKLQGVKEALSPYGRAEGWLICVPLTNHLLLGANSNLSAGRIARAVSMATRLGADIIGLGGLTSAFVDTGAQLNKSFSGALTSGSSYVLATALDGFRQAANLMGCGLVGDCVVVLGATSPAGRLCSVLLAREAGKMILVDSDKGKLEQLAGEILFDSGLSVRTTGDIKGAFQSARLVVAAAELPGNEMAVRCLPPGAVVCDLTQPPGIARQLAGVRNDVLVFEGGVVRVPGGENCSFDHRLPPGTACPRLAETMALAMEESCQVFPGGFKTALKRVEQIKALAGKHGFSLAGLINCGRLITPDFIQMIRSNARVEYRFN